MTLSGLNSETIFRTEKSLIAQTCSSLYTPYTVFNISFQRFSSNVYSEPPSKQFLHSRTRSLIPAFRLGLNGLRGVFYYTTKC